MIIKKLTITPVGLHSQKEIYRSIDAITAGKLIKGRLYSANGYDTKIPKNALVKAIGKDLVKKFDINPESLVLPSASKFVYNA